MKFLGLLTLIFSLSASVCQAKEYNERLSSPPLAIIGKERLILTIPQDWKVVKKDIESHWNSSNYEVQLLPKKFIGRAGRNQRFKMHLEPATLEIAMYALTRARRHGELSGRSFMTSTHLKGTIRQVESESGHREWYLTIPVHKTGGAIVLRVLGLPGNAKYQTKWAWMLFKSARFVGIPK